MAHEVTWDDAAQTVIRQRFYGDANISDYYAAYDKALPLIRSVPYPVDLLLDLRDARVDMGGFLSAVRSVNKRVPDNQRFVVVIGGNRFIQLMGSAAQRIAPRAAENLHFVDTDAECSALLARLRADPTTTDTD